jgi:hypothetical protein
LRDFVITSTLPDPITVAPLVIVGELSTGAKALICVFIALIAFVIAVSAKNPASINGVN